MSQDLKKNSVFSQKKEVKPAGGRTKEELLAIRKAMMKPSGLSKRTESSAASES